MLARIARVVADEQPLIFLYRTDVPALVSLVLLLHPILVNVHDVEDLTTTVRELTLVIRVMVRRNHRKQAAYLGEISGAGHGT